MIQKMSELDEQRWAVLSERGCEGSGLTYDEARALLQDRKRDDVHGLSIVTAAALRRLTETERQCPEDVA